MTPEELEKSKTLASIINPYATTRLASLGSKRMVHYTSAENAYKIISSKQMWLRNTNTMSDYSEVVHGYQFLQQYFHQDNQRNLFYDTMSLCYEGVGQEAIQQFDSWWSVTRFGTYIACVSEHEDEEDTFGRLSMWRGFNQSSPTRAAIVMNVPEFGSSEGLHLMLSPVAYAGYADVEQQMWDLIAKVRANVTFLQSYPREQFRNIIFFLLVSAAVSLKHISFKEEREWRVVYLPNSNPSPLITSSIEVISGIPQIVYKVPLEENAGSDVVGVGIPALVNRIIIGPTAYGAPMELAFRRALQEAGVPDPARRVVVSGIPIRS